MLDLRRAGLLAGTALAVVLAITLVASPEAGAVVQFLLGKWVYSTSNGASLYLLVFLVLAAWRIALGGSAHPAAIVCLGVALAVGLGLNLWITLRYLEEMHIPWTAHAYHWDARGFSFTSLFHSHLGKTAFAVFGQALHWKPSGYDSGTVFLPWVPAWAAWGIALAFVVGLAASLLALPGFARFHGRRHTMLFVLTSALSLRAMLDGGLLAAATLPALAGWCWVTWAVAQRPRTARAVSLGLAVALVVWLGVWIQVSAGVPPVGDSVFTMLWVLLLAMPLGTAGRRATSALLVTLALALVSWDAVSNLWPLLRPLPAGCRAITFRGPTPQPWDCTGHTAIATYLHFGDDSRKPHGTLIEPLMQVGVRTLPLGLLIIDTNRSALQAQVSAPWQAMVIRPVTLAHGWLHADLTADAQWPVPMTYGWPDPLSRNNYSVYLWQFGAAMVAQGMSEFVVLPHTINNDGDL